MDKPSRVIGIIASVLAMVSMFAGATVWISMTMSAHTSSIRALEQTQHRQATSIEKHSELIGQHARLLMLLEQHAERLDILSDFMNRGDRFTRADGDQVEKRLDAIEEWITHAPPSWFREMFREFKESVSLRLDKMEEVLQQQARLLVILQHKVEEKEQ